MGQISVINNSVQARPTVVNKTAVLEEARSGTAPLTVKVNNCTPTGGIFLINRSVNILDTPVYTCYTIF
jgi:hypothetical protein